MPCSTLSPLNSFETRKKAEEYAIQHTPPYQVKPLEPSTPSSSISSLSTHSIQPITTTKTFTPIAQISPKISEPLLKKMEEIAQTSPSDLRPLDVLFFEIMKIMESETTSAVKTREMLLSAHKEWQHTLEKEMVLSSEKSRQSQSASNFFTRMSQAIGPLSVIIAGVVSCVTGGVGIVALGAAAIGALFFIDCLFDDVAKKAIASLLARGEKEEKEAWLQRIRLVSSIISLCLNMGTGLPQALQIAATVSQTALEGIQAGCGYSRDSAKARLLELNGSFEISKNSSDLLLQKWEQIMNGILERYELFMSIQKARSETAKQIIQYM